MKLTTNNEAKGLEYMVGVETITDPATSSKCYRPFLKLQDQAINFDQLTFSDPGQAALCHDVLLAKLAADLGIDVSNSLNYNLQWLSSQYLFQALQEGSLQDIASTIAQYPDILSDILPPWRQRAATTKHGNPLAQAKKVAAAAEEEADDDEQDPANLKATSETYEASVFHHPARSARASRAATSSKRSLYDEIMSNLDTEMEGEGYSQPSGLDTLAYTATTASSPPPALDGAHKEELLKRRRAASRSRAASQQPAATTTANPKSSRAKKAKKANNVSASTYTTGTAGKKPVSKSISEGGARSNWSSWPPAATDAIYQTVVLTRAQVQTGMLSMPAGRAQSIFGYLPTTQVSVTFQSSPSTNSAMKRSRNQPPNALAATNQTFQWAHKLYDSNPTQVFLQSLGAFMKASGAAAGDVLTFTAGAKPGHCKVQLWKSYSSQAQAFLMHLQEGSRATHSIPFTAQHDKPAQQLRKQQQQVVGEEDDDEEYEEYDDVRVAQQNNHGKSKTVDETSEGDLGRGKRIRKPSTLATAIIAAHDAATASNCSKARRPTTASMYTIPDSEDDEEDDESGPEEESCPENDQLFFSTTISNRYTTTTAATQQQRRQQQQPGSSKGSGATKASKQSTTFQRRPSAAAAPSKQAIMAATKPTRSRLGNPTMHKAAKPAGSIGTNTRGVMNTSKATPLPAAVGTGGGMRRQPHRRGKKPVMSRRKQAVPKRATPGSPDIAAYIMALADTYNEC